MSKRIKVIEVRETRLDDIIFIRDYCGWIAIDSDGRRFGGDTAEEARQLAEEYNRLRRQKEHA
jgi:hypothetical protein